MTNELGDHVFYESSFDERTGALARVVEVAEPQRHTSRFRSRETYMPHLADWLNGFLEESWNSEHQKKWQERFDHRMGVAFSPSPETLDIQITNWCNFGCPMCYQWFDHLPYQVAYGGGEPTYHPHFARILRETRALGVVPNYTTAGQPFHPNRRDKEQGVIEATNAYCGGVALTYHRWRGSDYFKEVLQSMKELIKVQLNIHVIADKDVVATLTDLVQISEELNTGPLNIVLLAYHPMGRGSWEGVMTKEIYTKDLPKALTEVVEAKHRLAFSEGLLPYFLSRPGLPMVTAFAEASEGVYSAYVDLHGRMSCSSFNPPPPEGEEESHVKVPSHTEGTLQKGWSEGWIGTSKIPKWGEHDECNDCKLRDRCGVTQLVDFMQCAFASHNKG
jgi:MoaA/NifB/PqqE/SkfB family radical SAM enzyme